MKKILLLTVLLFEAICSYGQSSKLVLIEEFSNTGCGPCAIINPRLDSLLMLRLGDVVSIKYHVGWPDPKDEFYLNEKINQDFKKDFYEITGVPSIIIDGKMMQNSMSAVSDEIDLKMKEKSAFKLTLTSSSDNENLFVRASAIPLQNNNNENLRLFVAVIEEEIVLDKPSKNGEQHYYNILRKMLPDGNGYSLPKQWVQNKEEIYETNWAITGFYNNKELAVIAFIQDISTKKVYETAYIPRNSDKTNVAKVLIAEDLPEKICTPHFTTKMKFRNTGKNAITQAIINVSVNGYIQEIPWVGKLEYLEYETITTPDFTEFALKEGSAKNNVEIWLSSINGTENNSDIYKTSFSNSLIVKNKVQLTIFTDKKPEETTWKLFDSSGEIIDQGGPYTEPRQFYKKTLNINVDDCYKLVFYDSGNNGIIGLNGNGYFKLEQLETDSNNKLVTQGEYKTSEHTINFKMVNVNTDNIVNSRIASNMKYDENTRSIYISNFDDQAHISILSISGITLYTKDLRDRNDIIQVNNLEKGVYLLVLNTNGQSIIQKITIY